MAKITITIEDAPERGQLKIVMTPAYAKLKNINEENRTLAEQCAMFAAVSILERSRMFSRKMFSKIIH